MELQAVDAAAGNGSWVHYVEAASVKTLYMCGHLSCVACIVLISLQKKISSHVSHNQQSQDNDCRVEDYELSMRGAPGGSSNSHKVFLGSQRQTEKIHTLGTRETPLTSRLLISAQLYDLVKEHNVP
ncbi:hypothetical protein E2C01_063531 [Portunus trituberculatus]|uniref:Uncharacterized protein n=1 Tax=Portunus trituberculatus TaxID=210409 RepID=A0A5B7HHV6_PORTR|nr:hypothetical protein [Portunus trituberculatus]